MGTLRVACLQNFVDRRVRATWCRVGCLTSRPFRQLEAQVDTNYEVESMANRLQTTSIVEATCEAADESGQLYRLLQVYLQDLSEAETPEAVVAALSVFGAYFRMPHVKVLESLFGRAARRPQSVSTSPGAPQAIRSALRDHPLFSWALEAQAPVFLSDVDRMLAARGIQRPSELAGIEGLIANFEIESGLWRHYGFFGVGATANGLSRSLLHVAALSAHQRLLAPQPRAVVARITPTAREQEVLDLAMAGLSDAGIARTLGLATRTVRFHLGNAKCKFRASTRGELIAHAMRWRGVDHG
jgi:DNA-binding CsgD family transcriptional regulator